MLVDDHPLFIDAFRELLAQTGNYEIVGTATTGRAALEICTQKKPDIALIDMILPDLSGPELIAAMQSASPRTQKVVLSGLESEEAVYIALMAGADYYIPKTMPPREFLETLAAVHSGQMALTGRVADVLHWVIRARRAHKRISSTELHVLRLFGSDLPVKEIANRTGKSDSAIYKIIKNVKLRFSARTDGDLRRLVHRLGMT